VLLAAGSGTRVGHDVNKVFLPLGGRRVFTWSLRWAAHVPDFVRFMLVVAERDRDLATAVLEREVPELEVEMVIGGETRHGSEWNAVQALESQIRAGELDVVVIHDAARPLAATETFSAVVSAAAAVGGAVPVRPQPGLVPADTSVRPGPDRVVAVQTPQAFRAGPLLEAYRRAATSGFVGTDTASCIEQFVDIPVHAVDGTADNIKITFPEDLFLAEHLLNRAGWDLSGRRVSRR
jgi:2-C-methyl-D-erythritol 4-phosphate cytidylyltransferase